MPEDEVTPEATPEDSSVAPEADADPSMEVVGAEDVTDPGETEVGTADVPPTIEPTIEPTSDPLDNPGPDADETADAEETVEDEPSVAENQANYERPAALSQAEYVQGLMVAGNDQGQADRRKTLARNRERRAQQHAALHRTNRPDNA
jgi:hypothetical protein